jgi:predicted alpha/beta-hydrolase family hydrolase
VTHFLSSGPPDTKLHVVLAHGAGAAMDSPFLETMTRLLTDRGLQVTRFEFDYMAARRAGGKRRPPPRAEALIPEYVRAVEELRAGGADAQTLIIGGKSMGGRVASMAADTLYAAHAIAGLVCLGYPFHPPGKPDSVRTAHLMGLACPALIVQGERDPFGARAEVEGYQLSPHIELVWVPDGDHDFGPRGGSGFTRKGNLTLAADAVAAFAQRVG